MKQWKAKIRKIAARWMVRFFLNAIKGVIAWEITMAKQEECKHEGQEGVFCGLCGKQLGDPDRIELEGMVGDAVRKVLGEYGFEPKKKTPATPAKRSSLADRLTGGKK